VEGAWFDFDALNSAISFDNNGLALITGIGVDAQHIVPALLGQRVVPLPQS
jgi:hypothetical protein